MSESPAIVCENVSVRLRVRHERREGLGKALSRLATGGDWRPTYFPALGDVTFVAEQGSAVGVIGRNGAGKSTLLRVIAGIHRPDTGRVAVRGKVATILSLTAGFQPELSAIDNTVLVGLLHGCSKAETDRSLESILSFAEIEGFLDVPVKVLSAGMKGRLGFSIAAHLGREVLLLDETLAVGDEKFRQKCMRKLGQLKAAGVTIVLVSHDIKLVNELSDVIVWLDKGTVLSQGTPGAVTAAYLAPAS